MQCMKSIGLARIKFTDTSLSLGTVLTTSKILLSSGVFSGLKLIVTLTHRQMNGLQLWIMFLDKFNRDKRFQCREFR